MPPRPISGLGRHWGECGNHADYLPNEWSQRVVDRLAEGEEHLVDRCLDARRHVANTPQVLGHGVGGPTEGDELAAGVGQFRELKRRRGTEFSELGQRGLGLRGVTDEGGKRDFRLLEIRIF